MTQKVEVIITCDLSPVETGKEVSDGVVTRHIATDTTGGWREVDLTKKFSDELDAALERFLQVSRPGSQPVARLRAGSKNSDRNAVIRAWALKTPPWDKLLPKRGRIPAEILDAFYATFPDLERPPAHRVQARLRAVPDPAPARPAARGPASKRQSVPAVPPVAKFQEAAPPSPAARAQAERTAMNRAIKTWAQSTDSPGFSTRELSTFIPPKAITDALRLWIERHPRRAKKLGFSLEDGKIRYTADAVAAAG